MTDAVLTIRSDTGPGGSAEGGDVEEAAARRLLARHAGALRRVGDGRRRRERAYALLARNGFAPETCATAAREFVGEGEPEE
jgi:hypothetical protein